MTLVDAHPDGSSPAKVGEEKVPEDQEGASGHSSDGGGDVVGGGGGVRFEGEADGVAEGAAAIVKTPSAKSKEMMETAQAIGQASVAESTGVQTAGEKHLHKLVSTTTEMDLADINRLEKERELQSHTILARQGIIHPEHLYKTIWDVWVCFLIIYSVLTVTYLLGFVESKLTDSEYEFLNGTDDDGSGGGHKHGAPCTNCVKFAGRVDDPDTFGDKDPLVEFLSNVVDACFWVDMVLSFTTAFMEDNKLIVARCSIVTHYLKGWFFIDFVSTAPLDKIVMMFTGGGAGGGLKSLRVIRTVRLVRLVKISRLLKMSSAFEKYEDALPAVNPAVIRLMKLGLLMGFVAHMNACLWYYVGMKSLPYDESWTDNCIEDGIEGRPIYCIWSSIEGSQYLAAIYWAFTTMTTVGYGDIGPSLLSKGEIAITILSQVVGTTIFAYVIGSLVNLVLNLDPGERHRKSQVEYLNNYMRDIDMSREGRKSLRRHFNYRLRFKSVFQEDSILELLPPHIRNPALHYLHRSTLPRVPWLCSLESKFRGVIGIILPKLKPAAYCYGDVINGPGLNAREMCFVVAGSVEEVHTPPGGDWDTPGVKPTLLGPKMGEGSHFAQATLFVPEEIQFIMKSEYRAAASKVMMVIFTRADYAAIKLVYKDVCQHIERELRIPPEVIHQYLKIDAMAYGEAINEGGDDDEGDDHHQRDAKAAGGAAPKKAGGAAKKPKKKRRGPKGR